MGITLRRALFCSIFQKQQATRQVFFTFIAGQTETE
jgi:hypothetical protein